MAVEILTLDSEHQNYETTFDLDGVLYRIRTRYNKRIDSWMMSLYDATGEPIAVGRRITVGNILFPWLVDLNSPAGQLLAVDSQDEDKDPGEKDLGTRVSIFYFDADELEAMRAQLG